MRPPPASPRLQALPGNRYRHELRRPWRDGTVAVELSETELIEKLVTLTQAPRVNLVRYFGTPAPNASLRPMSVRSPGRRASACCRGDEGRAGAPS